MRLTQQNSESKTGHYAQPKPATDIKTDQYPPRDVNERRTKPKRTIGLSQKLTSKRKQTDSLIDKVLVSFYSRRHPDSVRGRLRRHTRGGGGSGSRARPCKPSPGDPRPMVRSV